MISTMSPLPEQRLSDGFDRDVVNAESEERAAAAVIADRSPESDGAATQARAFARVFEIAETFPEVFAVADAHCFS
jgi:hypothetical protein